jgi:putative ABC transport system ATP-binding protein
VTADWSQWPGGQPAVYADALTKVHGEGATAVQALKSVTVGFAQGHMTAITGPSGSGKSTLLHCLAGLDRPTEGHVYLAGIDLGSLSDAGLTKLRRDMVGFVFQSFNLVPTLSARENIELPLEIAGLKVDADWFNTLVTTLGIADRLNHRPAQLSGGEQQRVAVARALIHRPKVVFADEPTGNLDTKTGNELLGIIANAVAEFNQTVVMVTHDPAVAARANRVIFLVDGQVVDYLDNPTAAGVQERIQAVRD